jgi:hypothetical protein
VLMAKRPEKMALGDQHLDAWERFERAVDVVAKSPPQHRAKATKPKKRTFRERRASSSKPKSASRRA